MVSKETLGGQPWDSGELRPRVTSNVDRIDPSVLLAEWWADAVPDPEEDENETAKLLAPFSSPFPGVIGRTSEI